MRGVARSAIVLFIALAAVPVLLLGLAAALLLFLYALLEELGERAGGRPSLDCIEPAHARERARKIATGPDAP